MQEIVGDIWRYHRGGHYIVITTNGMCNSLARAVMGRGIAYQAAQYYKHLPEKLGAALLRNGNHVYIFPKERILTMPVKHHWAEPADPDLIRISALELAHAVKVKPLKGEKEIYMVRPGCGNGKLKWPDVQAIIAPLLDDRFIVVERNP